MASNEEIEKPEPVELLDEAALNEEASRELAAMVAPFRFFASTK